MGFIKNLIVETELLEALDWDNEALQQLSDFLEIQQESFYVSHPLKLIQEVEEFFGERPAKIIKSLMEEEITRIKDSKNRIDYEN